MHGQQMSFKEKQQIADDFIKRVNPYVTSKPLEFDLRGYVKYVKEHGLAGNDIPESVIKKFQL